jgi:ketosteroid isomerase-like protein
VSERNVDLVRRIYAAWDAGRSASEWIADDIEYVNPVYAVEPGTRRGRRWLAAVTDTYSDFVTRPEEFIDAGDEEVVVLARYSATGSVSGVPVTGEHGYVWTIRDDLAVRFRWFQAHGEALTAAGLPPRS